MAHITNAVKQHADGTRSTKLGDYRQQQQLGIIHGCVRDCFYATNGISNF